MLVQFTTRNAAQPVAQYGGARGALAFMVPARTATYTADDMCGGPATGEGFLDPGMLHTALLTGLEPGERYWYRVGDAVSWRGGRACRGGPVRRTQQAGVGLQDAGQPRLRAGGRMRRDSPGAWQAAALHARRAAAPAAHICSRAACSAVSSLSAQRRPPAPTRRCTSSRWLTRAWVSLGPG